jgi:hypothetical protein
MAPDRLVFLDESGARTNFTRQHGRRARGRWLVARVPQGHWQTTTLLAAIRVDGLQAPMSIDEPIDAVVFEGYISQVLAPALRPGDVVIMDNLAAYKTVGIRAAIEAVGARLIYLPPYFAGSQSARGDVVESQASSACVSRAHTQGLGPSHWRRAAVSDLG